MIHKDKLVIIVFNLEKDILQIFSSEVKLRKYLESKFLPTEYIRTIFEGLNKKYEFDASEYQMKIKYFFVM